MDKLLLELKITYYGCESDSRSATGSGFRNTVKNIVKGINSNQKGENNPPKILGSPLPP